jgi:hypothetical protein
VSKHISEEELQALFSEVEAPPGLDKWRERIADVHAEEHPEEHDPTQDVVVVQLRPRPRKHRSLAVAAAVVAVVGLGGVVVASRLLTDTPPADPTMIIDGPDKTQSSPPPPTSPPDTSGSVTTPPAGTGQPNGQDDVPGGTAENPPGGTPGGPGTDDGPEPTWGPMTGDPSLSNTGVPQGATLRDHQGDLRITTAGQVVTDLRVSGTVVVEAPNVTLRRVVVVAPFGAPALQQLADNLTVVDSQLSGSESLTQRANGLAVRRSTVESGMTLASGADVSDSYVATADVQVIAGATGVLLRHNVMGRVSMSDLDGPIRNVTVQDSLLTQVNAPTEVGSASIHVLANRFRGTAPSTGWNPSAADYQWSGNVFADTGAPAEP